MTESSVSLTSRERLLRALSLADMDHIPCCFMSFSALRRQCSENMYELVKAERSMGLDSMLFIPSTPRARRPDHPDLRGLPVRFHPDVEIEVWREEVSGDRDILHKVYHTPSGDLTTSVRLSRDWPHGDHIPFVDDYQIPRSAKPLIAGTADLEALGYLLTAPREDDVATFRREAEKAHRFVDEHPVLLAGGWGVGLDMAFWLCGMEDLILMLTDRPPAFANELLQIIHSWNIDRMEVVLSAPVDLYIRRGWYEGCDFVPLSFFREVILPQLQSEAQLAHRFGAKYGYICTSGTRPMLDMYLEAGIDVLIGIDPVQDPYVDMALMKSKLGDRMCLWGGVSGAKTVEVGGEEEIRAAVRRAIETLGPTGFILSPVDNITIDNAQTWNNIDIFLDEWRKNWQT